MRTTKIMKYNSLCWQVVLIALVTVVIGNVTALAEIKKPNILIITGQSPIRTGLTKVGLPGTPCR